MGVLVRVDVGVHQMLVAPSSSQQGVGGPAEGDKRQVVQGESVDSTSAPGVYPTTSPPTSLGVQPEGTRVSEGRVRMGRFGRVLGNNNDNNKT